MKLCYPIETEADGDGWLISFPDLPEAITSGGTEEDIRINAADCLEEALAGRIVDHEEIPAPSPARGRVTVSPGSLIAKKALLYIVMREDRVKPAELARRMGDVPSAVTRLLDPRHASKPDKMDQAFAALSRRLVISAEPAA